MAMEVWENGLRRGWFIKGEYVEDPHWLILETRRTVAEWEESLRKRKNLLNLLEKADKRLIAEIYQQEQDPDSEGRPSNCNPADLKFGVPSHPASATCKKCTASKCCVIWDCPLRNEIIIWARADERKKKGTPCL